MYVHTANHFPSLAAVSSLRSRIQSTSSSHPHWPTQRLRGGLNLSDRSPAGLCSSRNKCVGRMLGELLGWRTRKRKSWRKQRNSRDWTQGSMPLGCLSFTPFLPLHRENTSPKALNAPTEWCNTAVNGLLPLPHLQWEWSWGELRLAKFRPWSHLWPITREHSCYPSLECVLLIPGGQEKGYQAEAQSGTEERMMWRHARQSKQWLPHTS